MLQLASYGPPHRWQPCQPDVHSLKYAQITQVHEHTSPIQSSHFTAICHRLQELFPSCVHELKDSWVNVTCVEGGADATDGLQESLSLSLLSKATVKYWAIRAFCQRESGVMGWGGGIEKAEDWSSTPELKGTKGTTAKNPARAHTNTQTAAVGKTQIQVTHLLTPSLPDLFSLSRAFLSLALSNPSLQTSYAFTRCIVFNVPNTKSERLERRLWNLSHGMHKFPLN